MVVLRVYDELQANDTTAGDFVVLESKDWESKSLREAAVNGRNTYIATTHDNLPPPMIRANLDRLEVSIDIDGSRLTSFAARFGIDPEFVDQERKNIFVRDERSGKFVPE